MKFKARIEGRSNPTFDFNVMTANDAAIACFQAFFGPRSRVTAERIARGPSLRYAILQHKHPTGIFVEVIEATEAMESST